MEQPTGPDPQSPPAPVAPEPMVEQPPASEPVRIKVGSREFQLSPEQAELAQAVQERERELGQRLTAQGRQLEEYRRMQPAPAQPPSPQQPQYPEYIANPNLLFERPGEVLNQLRHDIKQELHQETTARYWQQQRIEGWWSSFFDAHKDLMPAAQVIRGFVEATPALHTAPPDQIADYMRQQLLGAQRTAKPAPAAQRTQVEGVSGDRATAAAAPKPTTLSQQIRDLPGRKQRGR